MSNDPHTHVNSSVELRDLWRRFKGTGDVHARERLVIAYSPLVKYVAGRMASGLPAPVEESQLISYGLVGLINAIERFEPELDIKFETYAITRIKGAIIDELHSLDWVPRSVRARAREIEKANAKLEHQLQRAPTDEEMAAELGVSLEEFQDALPQISNWTVAALDELWTVADSSGDQVSLLGELINERAPDSGTVTDQIDLNDRVADAIARLPDREKLVVALYYYKRLTLREIGEVIGVTESRVSQLHARAVLRLRSRLSDEPAGGPDQPGKPLTQTPVGQPERLGVSPAFDVEADITAIGQGRGTSVDTGAGPEQFVATSQALRNTQARARFMTHYDHLTDDEVNDHARGRVGDTEMAAQRWLAAGDVFAVGSPDSRLYPAFQFSRGLPKPAVRQAVEVFRCHGASEWEIALWFSSPNPWLRATPAEVLDEHPSEVAGAAARVFETPV